MKNSTIKMRITRTIGTIEKYNGIGDFAKVAYFAQQLIDLTMQLEWETETVTIKKLKKP